MNQNVDKQRWFMTSSMYYRVCVCVFVWLCNIAPAFQLAKHAKRDVREDRKNVQTCNKRLRSCLIDDSLVEVANVDRNWLCYLC